MREADHWCLEMLGDNGGWPLLVAPLSMLRASAPDRAQLLLDLEGIVGGLGFIQFEDVTDTDAQEFLVKVPLERLVGIDWYASRGRIYRGVWIPQIIDDSDACDQIIRILAGQQPRLKLPEFWPHGPPYHPITFHSLTAARPSGRHAVAQFFSASLGHHQAFLSVPVDLIAIDEDELIRLAEHLARLDSLLADRYTLGISPRKSNIVYQTQSERRRALISDLWLTDWIEARGLRGFIMRILGGEAPVPL
jgi:hypothetical protein